MTSLEAVGLILSAVTFLGWFYSFLVYRRGQARLAWQIDLTAWLVNDVHCLAWVAVSGDTGVIHAADWLWLIVSLFFTIVIWNQIRKTRGKKKVQKLIGEKSRQILAEVTKIAQEIGERVRPAIPVPA